MQRDRRLFGPSRKCRLVPSVVLIVLLIGLWAALGFVTLPAYAAEGLAVENSGIVIEADITEYRFESGEVVVSAEGNARVSYGDFSVSADYIHVQVEPGEMLAGGEVVAREGSKIVRCDLFLYNIYTGEGKVLEPDAEISGLFVRGSEMKLSPGVLTLSNTHITGCELVDPCYRVTSKKLIIYPDDRVLAEWPVLWLDRIPVMVLPRLTLPLEGDRIAFLDGAGVPIPKFSYDSSDGFLVGFTYLDKVNDWARIRYEAAYASKHRGITLSAQADLTLGQGRTGIIKGDYTSWKGFSASFDYSTPLLDSLALDARFRYVPDDTGADSSRWQGFRPGAVDGRLALRSTGDWPVSVKLTAGKEIVQGGDLYRIPELEVSLKSISLPGKIGSVTLSGGFGRFQETSRSLEANRHHLALSFSSSTIRFAPGITGSLSLSARQAWYETGDTMSSLYLGTGVKASLGEQEAFGEIVPRLTAGVSYDFRAVEGGSPFSFDSLSPVNKASARLDYRISEGLSVGVSTSYDFRKQAIDDVGFLLMRHNHCYDIQATWNAKKKAFGFEVKFTR